MLHTSAIRNETTQNVASLTNRGGYISSPDDSCDTLTPDWKDCQNGEVYAETVDHVLRLNGLVLPRRTRKS